ncbi:ankyrin repeat domain-containing protein [Gemmata sp. G18]|uniref:Ankyrin repeat domain-containing protein n=1 Tax=Gemmata palustris TaxID=2822762 RepID=A0ABS5BKL5_9BACT|nr:ankyrin repeat domain-containing protein [Gemmata palustris]
MTLFAAVKLSRPDDVGTALMRGLPNKDDWPSPRDILDAALSAAIHDVENGNAREILEQLLGAGMDPNDRTPTLGRNYLHEACANGAPAEVVATLAPYIHNINETTTDGKTALDLCADYPHTSPNVIRYLADHGAQRSRFSG